MTQAPASPFNATSPWRGRLLSAGLAAVVVGLINLPYFLAFSVRSAVFSGVLVNPADGLSYLAKMREGWGGAWLFTLPYTAEPGSGVFLYTYYLFLGHLARWIGLSLPAVYTLARLAAGVYFLLAAEHFIGRYWPPVRARWLVWLAFTFSSGLGWLAALGGGFSADLWVAESIPFLSLLVSSHFLLAAGLMFGLLEAALPGLGPEAADPARLLGVCLATTLLAQVQPLGLLSVGLTLAGALGWDVYVHRRWSWRPAAPALVFGLSAAPWVLYDFLTLTTHPVLSGWNAQNRTPSPPLGEALIWGGLPLALAALGALSIARRRVMRDMPVLIWFGLGILALYAPWALQRRLSLGLYLPLILLAARGFQDSVWPRLGRARAGISAALLAAAMLSNLLVYAATLGAVNQRQPAVFLALDEAAGLRWLERNAPAGARVAAGPESGLFIPAFSPARVLYGHPFETVKADVMRQALTDLYAGRQAPADFLAAHPVDYIYYGPREAKLGPPPTLGLDWRVLFEQGGVRVYGR